MSCAVAIVCLQRSIMYHGSDLFPIHRPQIFNLPTPVDFENGLLFVFPRAQTTVVHFHGKGTTIQGSFWHYGRLYNELHANVAGIEYCGYGTHTCGESPSMKTILHYAKRSLDDLKLPALQRVVWLGASLGTSVATLLEYEKHVDGLILENPFTSVADLLWPIPSWAILDNWSVRINGTLVRTLFLTSERDEIVPPAMSKTLANDAPFSTQVILTGCNHGDAPAHPDYLPAIKTFLVSL